MSHHTEEILQHYTQENPGVVGNLRRLLNHGLLKGTGKLLIFPVDQGFEHGPDISFSRNDGGYNPFYHAELALEAGVSGFASTLGVVETIAMRYAGRIPIILKLNHNNALFRRDIQPAQHRIATPKDALRLGCVGIGYTLYPGSDHYGDALEALRDLLSEARQLGLLTVVWSYPRGGDLTKQDETALDVVAYAAHMAVSAGAHIVKVKIPSSYVRPEYAPYYDGSQLKNMDYRIQTVKRSCFAGRRLVVFSGGGKKDEQALLNEVEAIVQGGGDGSIIGRNVFQREKADSLRLLANIVSKYRSNRE